MVRSMTVEADGVLGLELVDPAGGQVAPWQPGAHVDVVLGAGDGVMVRQYSLCGDPADTSCYRLGVLRERAGRGGSAMIHDTVRPGDLLDVRGPTNHFVLREAPEYLFIAGGIGVTPLLPMVAAVAARSLPLHFRYGGRTATSMAFLDRLRPLGERLTVWPQDTHGMLNLRAAIGRPPDGMAVYCCGPEPLLQAVESIMSDWPVSACTSSGSRHPRTGRPYPTPAASRWCWPDPGVGWWSGRRSPCSTSCWAPASTCSTTAVRASAPRARPPWSGA